MVSAKQRVKNYMKEFGSYPSKDVWLSWGYHDKYYYQVKRELKKEGFI